MFYWTEFRFLYGITFVAQGEVYSCQHSNMSLPPSISSGCALFTFLHLFETAHGLFISLASLSPLIEPGAREILTFIAEFQSLLINTTQEYPTIRRLMCCSVSLTTKATDVFGPHVRKPLSPKRIRDFAWCFRVVCCPKHVAFPAMQAARCH